MIRVVNEYRLLDNCQHNLVYLGSVGADYMTRRLLYTNLPVKARWDNIRRIAARLALEDNVNDRDEKYATYVKALCDRGATYGGTHSMASICLQPNNDTYPFGEDKFSIQDQEYDLMAAAAYFNKLSIIEEKISNPYCLHIRPDFLGDPYVLAVMGGHHEAVDLLYRAVHKTNIFNEKNYVLKIACKQGSIDMARKVLPNWTIQGLERPGSESMFDLEEALFTPSVEIFEMLMRIKETTVYPKLSEYRLEILLNAAIKYGWLEMMRHLVQLCAPIDTHEALLQACQYGNTTAAQLLLDHGTEMDGREIGVAAYHGRWEMVRWLMNRGAVINGVGEEKLQGLGCDEWGEMLPIVGAVKFEREDLLREFVELGARLDGNFGTRAVDQAKKEGLESMLAVLEELGVEVAGDEEERKE